MIFKAMSTIAGLEAELIKLDGQITALQRRQENVRRQISQMKAKEEAYPDPIYNFVLFTVTNMLNSTRQGAYFTKDQVRLMNFNELYQQQLNRGVIPSRTTAYTLKEGGNVDLLPAASNIYYQIREDFKALGQNTDTVNLRQT